jgi:hypothetical protein
MTRFVVTEWHQVASRKTYDIDDSDLIEKFGSVERFIEIMSWQDQETFNSMDSHGEYPTDEETDLFWELTFDYDYDREDDWWTDRKGGYDVTVRIEDD